MPWGFDTWQESYRKDKDGFSYDYDLFILSKIIRPGYIDKYYQGRK